MALINALRPWSEAATAPSTERRDELLNYKRKAVESFFNFAGKSPVDASRSTWSGGVNTWRA